MSHEPSGLFLCGNDVPRNPGSQHLHFADGRFEMQTYRSIAKALGIIFFALACFISAHAQVTTGSVRGAVSDPNGAAMPNAKVTITKKSTGVALLKLQIRSI